MTSIIKLALVGACALSFAGCASVTSGTDQQISVSTPGANGASCDLTSPDGTYTVHRTPGTVRVDKSKHDLSVLCKKDGYANGVATISSNFQALTLGNVLVGGVIGIGIDAASGAMNEYPKTVSVSMRKETAPSAPVSSSPSDSSVPTS
ncbi:MAG: translation initiation factor 2 [Parvibaculaceae bacterium]|nr:translation initiation factor 2 [Parvibaculaceae bacterium]